MKSSKSIRQQYASSDRKSGKRSDKLAKLDRKSSRGMIYENEELRLRTININAEVERGQSDIKRLRRENEHLRREIWTLRDECDRLNKRFKARILETSHDHHGNCNARGSGASGGCSGRRESCDGPHSNSNSEESDSCDTCKGDNDDIYLDEYKYAPPSDCCIDGTCQVPESAKSQQQLLIERMAAKFNHTHVDASIKAIAIDEDQQLHASFDHLSVVSEETLSNSEVLSTSIQPGNLLGYNQDVNGSQSTLPSLVRPLTPLTPVEMIANELNDLQSAVPPLSYFENVVQQHMAPNSGSQSDSGKTTNSGKTVIQTNGWDYNLQSPFTQRKYPTNSSSSSSTSRSPAQTLTTFVPPTSTLSPHYVTEQATMSQNNVPNIETVAITTVSPSSVATINSPKHFFSPLKPRLKINTTLANRNQGGAIAPPIPPVIPPNYNPPDIFVTNALASPYHRPSVTTPTTASVPITSNCILASTNASGHMLSQRQSTQTDSANLEAILNDIETISEDILAIQLEKNKTRDYLPEAQAQKRLVQNDKNKKPYRSEMNLLLSYEGANPTITPTTATSVLNVNGTTTLDNCNTTRRARSLEREHTDSPSPNIPDPMAPFPNNRTYIGFDQLNAAAATAKPPLPPSQLTAQANASAVASKPMTPIKPTPPTPPTRKQTAPLIVPPSPSANTTADAMGQQNMAASPSIAGLTPNKSHLFAALANAAVAKRAQFRSAPLHLTRSLDTDRLVMPLTEQESPTAETTKRKGRRVSIVCSGSNSKEVGAAQITPASPTTTSAALGSCADLQANNPVIMHLRQTSHSTPNSPHSMRRGSYSIIETQNVGAPHHPHVHPIQSGPYGPQQQQQQQRRGSIAGQHRKTSQESPRVTSNSAAPDLAAVAAAAVASRSKCSRRHSDSTVASGKMRTSGLSIRAHHHHNHNQQHLHPTALISSNPHHSHQDSHDTGTSISDRNSNSFASSRESSTSFSMRSQRRKISVSSHTGGKIPWCGCWGNGCL